MNITSQIYLHLCQDIPDGIAIYLNWAKIPERVAMTDGFKFPTNKYGR